MSTRHLRLITNNQRPSNPCTCRTWGLLLPDSRDLVLHDLMQWARAHDVGLGLVAKDEHVVVFELVATARRRGNARRVLTELCSWSDCARVTLELNPASHFGSGAGHRTAFYASLGFRRDCEQPTLFDLTDSLIRRSVRGRTHVRL